MKRIILFLIVLILCIGSAFAQIIGDGSLANPYRGINAGDFTISGTKYFDGNLGVSSGTLTLAAGTKLVSLGKYSCILISGTGRLSAIGTSSQRITITADLDKDGVFGEPTDFWGNINISSSGTSTLNYCIIERGRRTRIQFLGGAIYVGASTISVDHSIIRYCEARDGGGIYLSAGSSANISNTLFLENVATGQGGGIFITGGPSPVISSSVFRNNSSASGTLKGGTIASLSSAPVIVNSTIVYSSSPASDGRSIYLENSSGAKIVNTIIWGGSAHIGLSGTPSSVFDICAIEGVSYTGCLNLSSTNNAPTGPNFVNPTGGDFTLTYASPLRDTGADSYTGITIPSTDYIGSGRVYITDFGAYEMIYSRWRGGTTEWTTAANWDAGFIPISNRNIVIPSGKSTYPTSSPGPSFTLNAGYELVMQPGSKATFTSLTNNGTLDIQSDASGIASLLTGSYSGASGSATVRMFLTGATAELDRWHYIAAPVTVSKTVFTDIEPENLLSYDETKVTTDVSEGWQWHDGYGGTTSFSNLEAKKGYDALVFNDTTVVFRNLTSLTTSIGQINLSFSGSGKDTSLYGYTLVGNSLTCGINWDLVTSPDFPVVRDAIYITKDNGVASYVNGVGINGGSAHIPPLQGFFVKTTATGTSITIPDNAREHNSTARYKSALQIPLVRLELTTPITRDEMVIRLEQQATNDFDSEYDAGKMFSPVMKNPQLYSEMNGETYSINSIPWPKTQTEIPLTIWVPSTGTYKIRRTQIQGLGNLKVTLKDLSRGVSLDLTTSTEYSFTAPAGTLSGRFVVTVASEAPAVKEKSADIKPLKVYVSGNSVCVLPTGNEWDGVPGKVRIFDITGKVVLAGKEDWFNSGELKEYPLSNTGGLLIVEITARGRRYLEKVVYTP